MKKTMWIQFCKEPVLGQVKTRIAATQGVEAALSAHIALSKAVNLQLCNYIAQVSERAPGSECSLCLSVGGAGAEQNPERLRTVFQGHHFRFDTLWVQRGADLGERMRLALTQGQTIADKVFIVGSDFPLLDNAFLEGAEQALDRVDIVLAPVEDGGFGVIGTRLACLPPFSQIEWGKQSVLADTVRWCEQHNFSMHLLDTRFDVDTAEDYQRWRSSQWCKA